MIQGELVFRLSPKDCIIDCRSLNPEDISLTNPGPFVFLHESHKILLDFAAKHKMQTVQNDHIAITYTLSEPYFDFNHADYQNHWKEILRYPRNEIEIWNILADAFTLPDLPIDIPLIQGPVDLDIALYGFTLRDSVTKASLDVLQKIPKETL